MPYCKAYLFRNFSRSLSLRPLSTAIRFIEEMTCCLVMGFRSAFFDIDCLLLTQSR